MVFNTSNIGNDIHCEKIWGFTIGLAIGFPITMDTSNSWYLYDLECLWTNCNSYSRHHMLYTIIFIMQFTCN
jgi:hypothetical protein